MTACINAGENGCMRQATYADGWCGECLRSKNKTTGRYAQEDAMAIVAHKVHVEELTEWQHWQVWVSSTTADRTQRKTLYAQEGERRWRVERRYYEHVKNVNAVDVVYEGDDLREAVRLYNGLG